MTRSWTPRFAVAGFSTLQVLAASATAAPPDAKEFEGWGFSLRVPEDVHAREFEKRESVFYEFRRDDRMIMTAEAGGTVEIAGRLPMNVSVRQETWGGLEVRCGRWASPQDFQSRACEVHLGDGKRAGPRIVFRYSNAASADAKLADGIMETVARRPDP